MTKTRFLRWSVFVIFPAIVIGLLIARTQGEGAAQTSAVSPNVAAQQALLYARDDGHFGGYVSQPAMVYGKLMTFNEARMQVLSETINDETSLGKLRNYPVWLVVLEGEFIEHVPAAPDIPSKDVIHSQMAIIIDANTAETMGKYLIAPGQRLSTSSLQLLPMPVGPDLPIPTRAPVSTTVPLPTVAP